MNVKSGHLVGVAMVVGGGLLIYMGYKNLKRA